MKRIVDFTFNNKTYAKLAEVLRKDIANTAFDGKVYLIGTAILNQILGIEKKNDTLNVVVDAPNGGITFPIWLTHKHSCHVEKQNPLIDKLNSSSVFNLSDVEEIKGSYFACSQSRNSFILNDDRLFTAWYGSIEEDAENRGFTIESIYYNVSDGCLYDFTGHGFDDIENKIIRSLDPKKMYEENPLKMLHAIRYSGELGFGIEKNTWFGIIESKKNILKSTVLSIRVELDRMLLLDKPSISIRKLIHSGMSFYTWPFLDAMANIKTMPYDHVDETLLNHTMKVVDSVPPTSLGMRLGALLHDIGKLKTAPSGFLYHQLVGANDAKKIMESYCYSKPTIECVTTIVAHHEDLSKFLGNQVPGNKFAKKFMKSCDKYTELVLTVIDANNKAQVFGKKVKQVPNFRNVIAAVKASEEQKLKIKNKPKPPINGSDIMAELHLKTGVKVGELVKLVKNEFEKNPKLTRDECLAICSNALNKEL